ncbi:MULTISPECIES: HAD family hydrolase [unclassified Pseudoxanthomonas]|uniref:HAD family hydrolase n=1 Tax=unclassified Pseudoxanthomonas TaxID=2645906 RepID=UPI0008E7D602|nr:MULTISPECIES: HAD family hydrolase [unclassified Pseudoxanthomonas]PPJ43177.1 HAD-IB family hydrolase [Pseudoxanthomonas sp. KAs_5_3]SFV34395.1 HAD-superfamily subfamily IB hydrolase, TIGR01490 [Pseudoxanthomonas sp. YR558]
MDLALFDFDGTLTTRETFPDFMRYAVARPRLLVGGVLLAPVVFGYRRGWIAGNPTRASIVQVGLRGVDASRLRVQGEAFAREVLPDVLRPEAMARLAWHRERGDRIVVVSGGLDVYLAPWCATQGVELLCSVLAERNGRITGYAGAQCVGEEKVRRVRALCDPQAYAAIHAYGDTHEDNAMLAMAHHRTYRGHSVA